MKFKYKTNLVIFSLFLYWSLQSGSGFCLGPERHQALDKKVQDFFKSHKYEWYYENISETDGQILYDLIIKHKYTKALEIGTSTGHSAIWIAWALSKTGGKLITIEINKSRYKMALENFKKAGLSAFIDARRADAHELILQLKGPFDFIFVDADKNWYKNYLKLLLPKLKAGGCFTAHNVKNLGYLPGIIDFLKDLRNLPNLETTIDTTSWAGLSISYKKSDK